MIHLACSRCERPLTRPTWIRGEAYGSTCAAMVAGQKQRVRKASKRRAVEVQEADPNQLTLALEDSHA